MRRLVSNGRNAASAEKLLREHYAAERAAAQSPSERAAAIEECVEKIEFVLTHGDVGSETAGSVRQVNAGRVPAGGYADAAMGHAPESPLGRWGDSFGSVSDLSTMRLAPSSILSFVAFQIRIIPARIWVTQAAIVAFVLWVCASEPAEGFINCVAAALGAIVAGMGVPIAMASKAYGMAELESACRFNCRSVAAARMVVIGSADVLLLGIAACVAPSLANAHALTFAVYACVPYFAVCAGSFAVSRRARGASAMAASVTLSLIAIGICVLLQQVFPWIYESTAVGVWAIAGAVAGVWLVREAYAFLRAAAVGIDAFGCLGRPAYNEKGCDISWN